MGRLPQRDLAASAALASLPLGAHLFELVKGLDQTFGINEGSMVFQEAVYFADAALAPAIPAGAGGAPARAAHQGSGKAHSTRGPGGTRKMRHLWQVAGNFRFNHTYYSLALAERIA